jgi:hypothetical protein
MGVRLELSPHLIRLMSAEDQARYGVDPNTVPDPRLGSGSVIIAENKALFPPVIVAAVSVAQTSLISPCVGEKKAGVFTPRLRF